MYRMFRAQYFRGSFAQAMGRGNVSYAWRSLLAVKSSLLQAGSRWRIGDESSVHIASSPWLSRPSAFQLVVPPRMLMGDAAVEVLLNPGGWWNEELFQSEFDSLDVDWIIRTPIHEGEVDQLLWHYDPKGRFTVQSAYWLASHLTSTTTPSWNKETHHRDD
ncbi:UNVERIFIED_CONTAM: hypothetical protein Sradi_2342000 [Sesamum radiatum]|uniref:Uncharacterized protein n=1 Tax=Sesamum radiatum TaxID=300843 RepID=A0AAW2T617_SESRA